MKENDIKQAEIKRERNARLIAEVEAANGVALGKKEEQKQKEKEEEMTIVRYNQEKAAREAAKAEEDRKIAEEKEREVARLREMQEKLPTASPRSMHCVPSVLSKKASAKSVARSSWQEKKP